MTGENVLEYTELDKHIQKLKLLRLLLEQQPTMGDTGEDGAESTAEDIYMFPIMMAAGIEQGYTEEHFISEILDFQKAKYLTLLSTDEEADWEQSIQEKKWGQIQICLNKEQMFRVLVDNSLILNNSMRNLMALLQKQVPVWEDYGNSREEMAKQYQEAKELHDESMSMKTSCEETIENDKQSRVQEAEQFKEDIQKSTTNQVAKQLEEELKLSGKIGSLTQDMQKDIIQYMGIFIAIFALLGLNISNAENWTITDFFHINLVIIASMATLLFLISIIMKGKSARTACMGILTTVLWMLSVFVFFVLPCP